MSPKSEGDDETAKAFRELASLFRPHRHVTLRWGDKSLNFTIDACMDCGDSVDDLKLLSTGNIRGSDDPKKESLMFLVNQVLPQDRTFPDMLHMFNQVLQGAPN